MKPGIRVDDLILFSYMLGGSRTAWNWPSYFKQYCRFSSTYRCFHIPESASRWTDIFSMICVVRVRNIGAANIERRTFIACYSTLKIWDVKFRVTWARDLPFPATSRPRKVHWLIMNIKCSRLRTILHSECGISCDAFGQSVVSKTICLDQWHWTVTLDRSIMTCHHELSI